MRLDISQTHKLSDICIYVKNKVASELLNESNYIFTENMLINRGGINKSSGIPASTVIEYCKGDLLVSNIRPYFKKIWYAINSGGCSADVLNFRAKNNCNGKFIYYVLSDDSFFNYTTATSKETKMPRGDKTAIMDYNVFLPLITEQKAIADTSSCPDDKIELNNRMNKTLEEMAQAIFKSWLVDFEHFKEGQFIDSELGKIPKGWRVGMLTAIADYLNGLVMQKYRPEENNVGMSALKIKELRQGSADDSSDQCSTNIESKYIVYDGDVIFSWSGSLLVDIWCGGKCGLNQHLFKVTSAKFEKWFYYMWMMYHLEQFQAVAKDKATTMGHIKRGDLEKVRCLVPDEMTLRFLNATMEPIIDKIKENKMQTKQLEQIRKSILPKLMSGEIRVPYKEVV